MFSVVRCARWLAVIVLVLMPIAAIPLVGTSIGVVSLALVAVVACVVLTRATGWRPSRLWWTVVVAGLTLLGCAIGILSALVAIVAVGSVDPYIQRVGFGYAALVLAGIAGAAGLFARRWPGTVAAAVMAAGLAGAVAINLFYINTFYVLAVPLWLIAAVASLVARKQEL